MCVCVCVCVVLVCKRRVPSVTHRCWCHRRGPVAAAAAAAAVAASPPAPSTASNAYAALHLLPPLHSSTAF